VNTVYVSASCVPKLKFVGYRLETETAAELRLVLTIGSVMEVHHPVCILALGSGQYLLG